MPSLRNNPSTTLAAVALSMLVLTGCLGEFFDTIIDARASDPTSSFIRCSSAVREPLTGTFITADQLACDCQAIDGRDPKCWGYSEYKNRPMPLALTEAPEAVLQGAGDGPQIPLDGIVNAASFAIRTLPAGGIAQGSIFSIFGADLGPADGVGASSFPLGTELAGVSVRVFTLDGSWRAIPLFVRADQINAIMPSATPLGHVAVEVTFNGKAGNVAPARIEPASVGVFTASSAGFGPASVTNFVTPQNRPPNGPTTPATPGQVVTVWATGLGGIDGPDDVPPGAIDLRRKASLSPSQDIPLNLEVYIGGARVTNILYAGRSPQFAGLDQIDLAVPAGALTGCNSSLNVIANGIPANGATMALAAQSGACEDLSNPISGFATPAAGNIGAVSFVRLGGEAREELDQPLSSFAIDLGSASFVQSQGVAGGFSPIFSPPPLGSCMASSEVDLDNSLDNPSAQGPIDLDAGALLTVTRFDGAERTIFLTDEGTTPTFGGGFAGDDSASPPLFFDPGDYRIVGPGGAQVGAIDTTVNLPSLPAWSNKPSLQRIRRQDGFRTVWTGGSSDQFILLLGTSTNGIEKANASFVCSALGSAGAIDVPGYILANFPPGQFLEDGGLIMFTAQTLGSFDANGLDAGTISITAMDAIPVLWE